MSDRTPKIVLRPLGGSGPVRPAADDGRKKCKVGRQDRRPMQVSLAVLTIHLREEQIGDYEPPAGLYGVRAEELLRLDCGTGKVIGVVPAHG